MCCLGPVMNFWMWRGKSSGFRDLDFELQLVNMMSLRGDSKWVPLSPSVLKKEGTMVFSLVFVLEFGRD